MSVFNKAAIGVIGFYRKHISKGLNSKCIYTPTCSAYAVEALFKHGFFYAVFLIIKRLLRCNPLKAGGFDPVPDKKRDLKWLI
ncbi:MAG: membrane protein insertion efficiency factor YidD [Clostridia bacterium]|nr:membrane protein insertion efficiency factor YidD [Clostridia bacterium]